MIRLTDNDINIIFDIPPVMTSKDKVAIDTEIFGIPKGKLHRPLGDFGCAIFSSDGYNVYMVFKPEQLQQAFDNISKATHVYHNSLFDVRQIRRWAVYPDRMKIWDTALIEMIVANGLFSGDDEDDGMMLVPLKDLARRYCGIYLSKEARGGFAERRADYSHWANGLTDEEIFYSAADAAVTWRVFDEQRKVVDDTDYEVWMNQERPTMFCVASQRGVHMDANEWTRIYEENLPLVDKSQFDFNPNASGQIKTWLASLGLKVDTTEAKELRKYKDKYPDINRLLEYKSRVKLVSTYGVEWLKHMEEDGRVYTDWRQIGAVTGRWSSNNPNLQNIPSRKFPRFRDCFTAGEGNVLIIADYSSQEPRIAAHLSGDEKLIEIFASGKDPYCTVYFYMYDEEITKKDERRKLMKQVVLGLSYGMTEYGLANKINDELYDGEQRTTTEEAKEMLEMFHRKFPQFYQWSLRQRKINTYVTTIYGRKCWLNPYSKSKERNTLNSPVQGSASDIYKRAICNRFLHDWKEYASGVSGYETYFNQFGYNPIVLHVHDEVVIEVPEGLKEDAMKLLEIAMNETAQNAHTTVPSAVEIYSGKRWSEKH